MHFLSYLTIEVRPNKFFFHFLSQSDYETICSYSIVTFLISDALIIEDDKVASVVLEIVDVRIGLQREKLSWSYNKFAVGGGIEEIKLRSYFETEEKR